MKIVGIAACTSGIAHTYIAKEKLEEALSCGEYDVVIYEKPKKLSKFLDKIQSKGYYGFCFLGEEIRELKN